jgi:hypothetical protein
MANRKAPHGWKDGWRSGEIAFFEYHCYEGHDSCDAEIWYRSRQPVLVLGISEPGGGRTYRDRAEDGMPRVYRVRFLDGFEYDVCEDELMIDERHYDRGRRPGERP